MGEILGSILEGILRLLIELVGWIPAPRWNGINGTWAWPIGFCLGVALLAFIGSLWFEQSWIYHLSLGAFAVTFGVVCIAAIISRPNRGGGA